MVSVEQSAILFSGGSDSTLAAALFAERFGRVHLITLDRFSFIGARKYTLPNYERLCRTYGQETFERVIVPVGKLHKAISYHDYFGTVRRHGRATAGLFFSKIAMHARVAAYCIEHGIQTVGDGMVPYMSLYPDQNRVIAIDAVQKFYASLGIIYENPVWDIAEDVEQMLYDKGVTDHPRVRGGAEDKQVFYAEQVLFALFAKYMTTKYGSEGYEQRLKPLFQERLTWLAGLIRAWKKQPLDSEFSTLV